MSDVSFEKKLEVAAKAMFRSRHPEDTWKTWQDTRDELRLHARKFVENLYEWNKEDAELNTELDGH